MEPQKDDNWEYSAASHIIVQVKAVRQQSHLNSEEIKMNKCTTEGHVEKSTPLEYFKKWAYGT